jgi:homoserine dehydrogenase
MFYGRGAGKLPTASAVSADVLDAVKHKNRRQNMDWLPGGEDVVGDYNQLPLRWYIRTEEREMRIGTVFGDVEMVTVPTLPGQTALFTGELTRQQLEEKLQGFEALTCLPILA